MYLRRDQIIPQREAQSIIGSNYSVSGDALLLFNDAGIIMSVKEHGMINATDKFQKMGDAVFCSKLVSSCALMRCDDKSTLESLLKNIDYDHELAYWLKNAINFKLDSIKRIDQWNNMGETSWGKYVTATLVREKKERRNAVYNLAVIGVVLITLGTTISILIGA